MSSYSSVMEPSNKPVCDRIITYNNATAVIPGYEGIPQNLLINVILWLLLLLTFCVLRKLAWDHGRMALTQPKRNRWATLFYSEVRKAPLDTESYDSCDLNVTDRDSGLFSWLRFCCSLTDADLERKCGIDAVHYLRFQIYMIIYTAITMFFCLVVILPLNITGTLKSPDLQSFGVTTISNLPSNSLSLWAHTLFGILFFSLAFSLMQHFSKRFWNEASLMKTVSHRTLMISGISRSHCHRELVLNHLREAYPNCEIDDIQVCFDIRRLISLDTKLESAKAALDFSQRRFARKGTRPVLIPRYCGWFCTNCSRDRSCTVISSDPDCRPNAPSSACCVPCACTEPVDAIDYYNHERELLLHRIEQEGSVAIKKKIGIAFVTFATRESAAYVYKSFHSCRAIPSSSVSKQLRTNLWTVQFAPTPNNIIWPNLATTRTVWWTRAIVINLCVFLLVFFLTTPTYVLNLVNKLTQTGLWKIDNPIINQFLPSIILWSVSALLPCIVFNSDRLVGHWTRSGLHLIVMMKTFTLLILMVLLLPSLGLTSIPALLQWLFPEMRLIPLEPSESGNVTVSPAIGMLDSNTSDSRPLVPIARQSFQWECVFMADNGAFFVNYVITSAFIGTALQLARIPELFVYFCRIMCVRSQAEKASVRKRSQWEFDFGLQYAWTLCVFAVISSYSILCPLITPAGFLYLLLRYLVDRYNLFFAYLPSRIDSRIHWLAINLMLAAVLLLQLNLFMFIVVRLGAVGGPLSIVSLVGLLVSTMMWLVTIVTGWIFVGSTSTRYNINTLLSGTVPVETDRWGTLILQDHESYVHAADHETPLETVHPVRRTASDSEGLIAAEPSERDALPPCDVPHVEVRCSVSGNIGPLLSVQPHDGWLYLTTSSSAFDGNFQTNTISPFLSNLTENSRISSEIRHNDA